MAKRSSAIDISAEDNASEVFARIDKSFDRMADTMERAYDLSKKLALAFVGFEAAKGALNWLHEGAKKAAGDGTFTNYEKALAKVGWAWEKIQIALGAGFDGLIGNVLERLEPIMNVGLETMFRMAEVTTEVLFPALESLFNIITDVFFGAMDGGAKSAGAANNSILASFKAMGGGVITALTVVEAAMLHLDSAWEMAVLSAEIQFTKMKDAATNVFRAVVAEFKATQESLHPGEETLAWEKESRESKSLWRKENERPDLTGMTDEKLKNKIDALNARDPRKRVYQNQTTDIAHLEKALSKAADKVFGGEFSRVLQSRLDALGAILGSPSGIAIPAMRNMKPAGDPDLGGGDRSALFGGRHGGGGGGGNMLASHYLAGSNPDGQMAELKKANELHKQHLLAVARLASTFEERDRRRKSIEDYFARLGL